jgi:hypothetical protein
MVLNGLALLGVEVAEKVRASSHRTKGQKGQSRGMARIGD